MTLNKMLYEAADNDEMRLAYSLWWIKKNDLEGTIGDLKQIDWNLVNHDEVNEMIKNNELGFTTHNLFAVPIGDRKFVFIFSKTELDAKQHFHSEFKYLPGKILDMNNSIDKKMYVNGKVKSFREIRKEKVAFPCTVMVYEKSEITEKRRGL